MVKYFVEATLIAQYDVKQMIDFTLKKIKTFDLFKNQSNDRQIKVLQKMYSFGPEGFRVGMAV